MSRKELAVIPTKNKDIVTSFVYTWARQKEMSILEQRVVLRIMEYASNHLKGEDEAPRHREGSVCTAQPVV